MTNSDKNQKKELARLYFMQGDTQQIVAEKVGVSRNTLSRWVQSEGWDERRAALNVTRPEIVNKNLLLISRLLDKLNSDDIDVTNIGRIVDQISKLAASIERIDKKANVVDAIEIFRALNRWLVNRMEWDKEVTPELIKVFEHYQQLYVSEQLNALKK